MLENAVRILKATRRISLIVALGLTVFLLVPKMQIQANNESLDSQTSVAMENLEKEYTLVESMQNEIIDFQNYLESALEEEWFVQTIPGVFVLVVPEEFMDTIDLDAYTLVKNQLEITQQMVQNGILTFDVEQQSFFADFDYEFVVQAGKNDFKYHFFTTFGIRWYTGWQVWLDNDVTSKIMKGGLGIAGIAAILSVAVPATAPIATPLALIVGGVSGVIAMLNWNDRGITFGQYYTPRLFPAIVVPTNFLSGPSVPYVWAQ